MTNKMTNRKALAYVLDNMTEMPTDVREKLKKMAETLDNKANSANRKPTAKQIENAELRKKILEFMRSEPNRVMTCTEIGKSVPELDGMNNQKISALVRPLVDSEEIKKFIEKGKSLFQAAEVTE